MRNDAHDELDHVPSLTADRDKPYPEPEFEPLHKPAEHARNAAAPASRRYG